jgi:hypothetical protein
VGWDGEKRGPLPEMKRVGLELSEEKIVSRGVKMHTIGEEL